MSLNLEENLSLMLQQLEMEKSIKATCKIILKWYQPSVILESHMLGKS